MILPKYKDWFAQIHNNTLDHLATQYTEEAYQSVNCLDCGQCCKTTVTTFDEEDITRAAKFLSISRKEFIKKYLIVDLDKTYTTISTPCPMLDVSNNKCNIYEVRPKICASFPHTQRPFFIRRKSAHLQNAKFCLITQYVLNKLIDNEH
ncbi:MAG TPA: YkgJ family cysteine cluster protein [Saprospiraceae bacterium]|nr:YkgJ family cysteine cluster protein [Saprospiraceae bacterium]